MIVVTGCGAVHHKVDFKDKYIPPADTKIELGRVMNKTGEEFDIDIKKMLSDSLGKTLKEKELLWSNTGGPRLLLESNIIDYKKGDAFKRWLLPGWGSTLLIVRCDLVDDDNNIVGSVKATRAVSIGGVYSIGAWKTVFDSLANDVVKDLSKSILASKDRKPDKEKQKEYKSEVNYQRPIEERDKNKLAYIPKTTSQMQKESDFKLGIFPGLLTNSASQWISDKDIIIYIKDALNKSINSNKLLVPTFSYYEFKNIRTENISDDILSKNDIGYLWLKDSSSTSEKPNVDLICQLGEKLQVDAILTYYTYAYTDSHELFGDFTVSLINVRTKKTYSEKQTCSIRWSLDQDLNKAIKKLYINFEKDSIGNY
jgi:hypothetical protein